MIESNSVSAELKIFYTKGKFTVSINNTGISWDLKASPPQQIVNTLANIKDKMIESRLYGFDRYGLAKALPSYTSLLGSKNVPVNILSELGWNTPYIVKECGDVLVNLNRLLKDYLNEEIAVVSLLSGAIAVFDYWNEVIGSTVSDTIYRILYYLLALASSMNYTKLYGLEGRFILLLEEPEAHVFPYFLDLLAEHIRDSLKLIHVVVVTHNPLFVSMLWDKIKDVRTYYVFRESDGSTNAVEIDIEKLAKDLRTSEELLFMPSSEVIDKYSAKKTTREGKDLVIVKSGSGE